MSQDDRKKRRVPVKDRLHFALPHIESFKDWLDRRGYTKATITEVARLLAHWTDWVFRTGFTIETIQAGFEASALPFKSRRTGREQLRAGALFIRYLQDRRVVPRPEPPVPPTTLWPILAAFRDWMQAHRGVTRSSLDTYQTILIDLLEALGDDAAAFTPQAIRGFILDRARPHGRARAATIVTATRAFLRFLTATGRCRPEAEYAVPGFANWQLATVPEVLGSEDIECVIAACEGEHRLRDRAVILLLARLGLRASEAANLTFHDIDWGNGRLAIMGKSRRAEWLPLTQEVGDALIAYIERARPRVATPRLFITDRAPTRPMTRVAVKHIVRRALIRAGIRSTCQGAHILRHSAAAAMLRHGVSLSGIGAVLRHRSLTMTMYYAKVDFALLSEIAQPWAGWPSC